MCEPCRARRFLLLQEYQDYQDSFDDFFVDGDDFHGKHDESENLPVKAAAISLSCLPGQWQIFLANLENIYHKSRKYL